MHHHLSVPRCSSRVPIDRYRVGNKLKVHSIDDELFLYSLLLARKVIDQDRIVDQEEPWVQEEQETCEVRKQFIQLAPQMTPELDIPVLRNFLSN